MRFREPLKKSAAMSAVVLLGAAVVVATGGAGVATSVPSRPKDASFIGVVPLVRFAPVQPGVNPYDPAQIQYNYDMGPLYKAGYNGRGRTIGIVDAYGSPTITADLAAFDANFGLPAPPHFTIVRPAGPVPAFNPANPDMDDWAFETTLDVEWAHAMAPGANIVLAETPVDEVEGTSGMSQIMTSENYLITHESVAVISQSFAATEETFRTAASLMDLRAVYGEAEKHRVTIVSASGDWGATGPETNINDYYTRPVVGWPASDPLVTAVGGTDISLNGGGQPDAPMTVWNQSGPKLYSPEASGGGVSEYFSRPSWQSQVSSVVGSHRGMPDVSMLASCDPGVWITASFLGYSETVAACGTSLATPLFAGVVVVAAQLANGALGLINPKLYELGESHAPGLVRVDQGSNSVSWTVAGGQVEHVTGYNASRNYNLAVGWGTVNGSLLVQELAGRTLPK